MNTKAKRIPYGMMNFVAVREDDCYYVDKTRFIEKVEAANKFFFFIRPRRFGKSLTMSMLRHYYDVNQAPQGLCRLSRSGDGGVRGGLECDAVCRACYGLAD